ncbi:BsuPI-related putative proteinase inhibitor [Psychrobacillus sp. NEAU-3TGS]|uniref:BsuPI-related putative proteinase inhibitor n=1 Tax=Psychrobacillus sp. NEAU-3TGS TaxID=2995412 RepID=UPI0024969183|nr:BsuPI-related putative proteinase inhibitor [Psychrobacillus sp. NEAU-3TGS]MDI2587349.1 BsuPI-related putative proteinase inhibitor [Psychrobacillus sp. NEAU-3TGS]
MKKLIWGVCSIFIILLLAGCGTSNGDPTTGGDPQPQEDKTISTKLEVNEDGNASFTIKNETEVEKSLTYPSGQEIEYQLLDNENNIVYTYSANKTFTLMLQEKILKPSEELVIPLELQTELAEVPAGSYTLIAWSTSDELSEQKEEVAYEWAGNKEPESTVTTEKVTVYQADANAEYVEPYDITIDPSGDVVRQIFEEIMVLDVGLIDYRFENNNTKLILNMDSGLNNVQGSAGEHMFIGTIVHSFFDNFPDLEEIYFEREGKSPVTLAHLVVTEPFTRDQVYTDSPN